MQSFSPRELPSYQLHLPTKLSTLNSAPASSGDAEVVWTQAGPESTSMLHKRWLTLAGYYIFLSWHLTLSQEFPIANVWRRKAFWACLTKGSACYAGRVWCGMITAPFRGIPGGQNREIPPSEQHFGVSHCLGLEEQRLTFYSDLWEVANDLVKGTGIGKRQDWMVGEREAWRKGMRLDPQNGSNITSLLVSYNAAWRPWKKGL